MADDAFALYYGNYVGQPNNVEVEMEADTPNFYKYLKALL